MQVCNPLRSADLSNSEWDALRGRWARQQTTAFPLQKLQRLLPDQPPADLTEEELQGALSSMRSAIRPL